VKAHEPLFEALARAARQIGASALPEFRLETPRDPAHGDAATNLALLLAKGLGKPPRAVADQLVRALELPAGYVEKVEIAGPGFINFFLAEAQLARVLPAVLAAGEGYGRGDAGRGRPANVEFVSANPTGPLHVGHGRRAADRWDWRRRTRRSRAGPAPRRPGRTPRRRPARPGARAPAGPLPGRS